MRRIFNKKSFLTLLLLAISIVLKNTYYIFSSIILVVFNFLVYKNQNKYSELKISKHLNKLCKLDILLMLILTFISMAFAIKKDNIINSLLIGLCLSEVIIPYNIRLNKINSEVKMKEYNMIIRGSIIIANLLVCLLDLPYIINPCILLLFEILVFITSLYFKLLDRSKEQCLFENEIVTIIQAFMISSPEVLIYAYILGASENIILGNTIILTIFILANFFLFTVKIRKKNNINNMIYLAKNNVYLFPLSLIVLILLYLPLGNKIFNTSKITIYSLLLCFILAYIFVCWYDLIKLVRRSSNGKSNKEV